MVNRHAHGYSELEVLTRLRVIGEHEAADFLSEQYGYPKVHLRGIELNPGSVIALDLRDACRCMAIPYDQDSDCVYVAMVDPTDTVAVDFIQYLAHARVAIGVAVLSDMRWALDECFPGYAPDSEFRWPGDGLLSTVESVLLQHALIDDGQRERLVRLKTAFPERVSMVEAPVRLGLVDEDTLAGVLSKELGIPTVSLPETGVIQDTVDCIGMEDVVKFMALPYRRDGETLLVAMADPTDGGAIDVIRYKTNRDIKICVATVSDIRRALGLLYDSSDPGTGKPLDEEDEGPTWVPDQDEHGGSILRYVPRICGDLPDQLGQGLDHRFEEIVFEAGLVDEKELQRLTGLRERIERQVPAILALVRLSILEEHRATKMFTQNLGFSEVGLSELEIDKDAVKCLDVLDAYMFLTVPYRRNDDTLHVAMADPSNPLYIDYLRCVSDMDVVASVGPLSEVVSALADYYPSEYRSSRPGVQGFGARLQNTRIAGALFHKGAISREQAERVFALKKNFRGLKHSLLETLLRLRIIDEKTVVDVLATEFGMQTVSLRDTPVDRGVIELLDKGAAYKYMAFPYLLDEQTLHVAMADPFSIDAHEDIKSQVGLAVGMRVAPLSDIKCALETFAPPEARGLDED
ncbi:hypothetical protein ACFL2Q_02600 [Thermodesulfobacteriota bacterium]